MENNKPKSTDFDIGDYLLYQMASLGGLVCFITVDDTLFLSVVNRAYCYFLCIYLFTMI